MLGGLMVGFSATYQWQTIFNSFGALSTVVSMFGLEGAIILRIISNVFGDLYAKFVDKVFDKIDNKLSMGSAIDEIV